MVELYLVCLHLTYSLWKGPIAAENVKNIILGEDLIEYKPQNVKQHD